MAIALAGFSAAVVFASTSVVAVKDLVVTPTSLAPPEGVFPDDNNVTMLWLRLQVQDEAVTITSMDFDFTSTSTAVDADIEQLFVFDDQDGEKDMDWFEIDSSPSYGVVGSITSPVFPQTVPLGYTVPAFQVRYFLVLIDVATGTEGVQVGLDLTGVTDDATSSSIAPYTPSDTTVKYVIWSDEMEGGVGGWTTSGSPSPLWHLDNYWYYPNESPSNAWWYANITEPNPALRNTYFYGPPPGVRNFGNLTTEAIDLSGYSGPAVSFWHDLRTENQPNADEGKLLVEDQSIPGVWNQIGFWRVTPTDNWTKETFDLDSYAGKTIKLRFNFDTLDEVNNLWRGWFVDRMYVFGAQEAHDVGVSDFAAPNFALPTAMIDISATIVNLGQSAEDNATAGVDAWLRIDGAYVQLDNIPSIPQGGQQGVAFQWNPGSTGDYEVCIHAWPVVGESSTGNNLACKTIQVRDVPARKIVVVRSFGTKSGSVIEFAWKDLNVNWESYGSTPIEIDWDTLNKTSITYSDISASGADVLLISSSTGLGIPQTWSELTYSEIVAIKQYTTEGHGLIATGTTFHPTIPRNYALTDMFGIVNQTYDLDQDSALSLDHVSAGHPLLTNLPDPFSVNLNYSAVPPDGSWDIDDLRPGSLGGIYVASSTSPDLSTVLVEFKKLVYFSWIPEWFSSADDLQALYNAMAWSDYDIVSHDVAMSSLLAPERVKPTPTMDITATLSNLAGVVEDNGAAGIDVELTEDGVTVDSTNIPSLGPGASTDVTLVWDPPATPTMYNICMKAVAVVGEIDTTNNEVCQMVEVVDPSVVIVQILDSWGTDNPGMAPWDDINANWATYGPHRVIIDYTYLDKENIDALDLTYSSADVVMISSSNSTGLPESEFTLTEVADIDAYVNSGVGIVGTGLTLNNQFLLNHAQLAYLFGIDGTQSYTQTSGVTNYQKINLGHTVFFNLPDPFTTVSGISSTPGLVMPDPNGWTSANLLPGGEYLGNSTPMPSAGAIVGNDAGTYRGIYLSNAHEMSSSEDDKQILYNAMIWAAGLTLYPSVPPDPPQDLWISKVGDQLELDWIVNNPEPDVHFNIFRSTTVDGFNYAIPYDQVAAPPYLDLPGTATDASLYFYVVRAINITSLLTETNTNKVGKFYSQLKRGTNDISIPFELRDTSVTVIFAGMDADIDSVSVYDTATATWLSYIPGVGGPLTDVDHTQGIRVDANKANVDFITVGRVPVTTDIILTIGLDSWFFVGYPNLLPTPGALPDVLDNNGLMGLYILVMYYDPSDRKLPWKWFDPNDPGGSPLQALEKGKGYWILMGANGIWSVPGE
jgi:hypothetical protein